MPSTVAVTGNILLPDGNGPRSGTMTAVLVHSGSVSDDRIVGRKEFDVADGGAVDFEIVPTDTITGTGVVMYRFDYRLLDDDGTIHVDSEYVTVPSSPDPTTIGELPRSSNPAYPLWPRIRREVIANRGDAADHPSELFVENRQSLAEGDRWYLSVQLGGGSWDWMQLPSAS